MDRLRKVFERYNNRINRNNELSRPRPIVETITNSLSTLSLSNSHSGFRTISLYPSNEDLTTATRPNNLKKNIIKGPYINVYHYLDIQFRLLREDFVNPLRQDICCYIKDQNAYLQNVKIHKVVFFRKGIKLNELNCYCLEMKGNSNIYRHEKRFMIGSILVFTNDDFRTVVCGKVASAPHISTSKQILVSFERDSPQIYFSKTYLMVEYSVFFEPYYNVLKVLQDIRLDNFPMQKYLIEGEATACVPKYLDGIKYALNESGLNPSQIKALNSALSQELVIIQGPPGTGKTYLGLKIAKTLLRTSKKWYKGTPMLVISFTNHALDQFLEGLMDTTNDILRFGGQSKNPKVMNFTMAKKRKEFYESEEGDHIRKNFAPHFKRFKMTESEIKCVTTQIDNIKTSKQTCIFYFNKLARNVDSMRGFFPFWREGKMISWLLEDDGSICGVNNKNERNIDADNVHEDANQVAELWEEYLKEAHTGSSYCMISVSIMRAASQALNGQIEKCTNEINKLRLSSLANSKRKRINVEIYLEKLKKTHEYLEKKTDFLKLCLKTDFGPVEKEDLINKDDPFKMPVRVRWQLYKHWLCRYEVYLREELENRISNSKSIYEEFSEQQDMNNLRLIKTVKVIGMTTTCASRMRKTLEQVKCPIIIVEEAAEVLESHIISVLTQHCEHLIMIGDHLQLKPSTSDYEIETQYKLGVSLFERMVNNDMEYHTLNVQHRMRPEISRLITPSVYPILHDHESVKNFPRIRAVESSVFFIKHKEVEQSAGCASKKNVHEAKFLVRFALYLLQNNYKPEEVTILAAYLGQVTALQQAASRFPQLKNVKISSVDNFQGEENKIILLSLVRNNWESKIGFLSTENRVCVALSRAKEGLYIMGNINQLAANSKLWQKIYTTLKSMNAINSKLPLKCQQHNAVTYVKSPDDFVEKVPEGGCDKVCGAKLVRCNHLCPRFCHADDTHHLEYKCLKPCKRVVCENNHICPNLCHEESCPDCQKLILLEFTECGHTQEAECYRTADPLGHDLRCDICEPSSDSQSETELLDNVIDFKQSAIDLIKTVREVIKEKPSHSTDEYSSDEASEVISEIDF